MDTIVLPPMDDMHLHIRQDTMMRAVLPFTLRYARRAIIMPNTQPAVVDAESVVQYRTEILNAVGFEEDPFIFHPLMTIEMRGNTIIEMIRRAHDRGIRAAKIYPKGGTTNSEHGFTIADFDRDEIREVFMVMRELDWKLLIHGEKLGERIWVMDREYEFLETFENLAHDVPGLKMVLEHISDRRSVELIEKLSDYSDYVAATITAHHLFLTTNEVIGDGIRPHNMCMPVAKRIEDLEALREAAMSGNPQFFAGSDSAPHLVSAKECQKGACGAFTAPHLPELYATAFDEEGKLDKLEDFLCSFGADFYGIQRSASIDDRKITLIREDHVIPEVYSAERFGGFGGPIRHSQCNPHTSIVPFMAGETLPWRLV